MADWWDPPNNHVLGGRDMNREERGTWLGITSDGRVAVLTNYREEGNPGAGLVSRGSMVNAYLTQKPEDASDTESFVKALVRGEGARGSGGFSLVCGRIGEPLAVVSNRTENVDAIAWIAGKKGETVGLSNTTFGDRSWKKVTEGEKGLEAVVDEAVKQRKSQAELEEDLFALLSKDTMPRKKVGENWESQILQLRNSIFIPPLGDDIPTTNGDELVSAKADEIVSVNGPMSGAYGTQKQTVVLVDNDKNVRWVQRTLFDPDKKQVPDAASRDQVFTFRMDDRKSNL
jgi:uncharacterized protein with NRDE domain